MPRQYAPVSGIPCSRKGPFRTAGAYHHRRDVLFKPAWGRLPERPVSRHAYPTGSTMVWQKDAAAAWPILNTFRTHTFYGFNEQRYLLPAVKARHASIQNYVLNQLDPRGTSGIGFANVRWTPTLEKQIVTPTCGKLSPAVTPESSSPSHITELISPSHWSTFQQLESKRLEREKIPALARVVELSDLYAFQKLKTIETVNPFPTVPTARVLVRSLRMSHILTINPKLRLADRTSWRWRRIKFQERRLRLRYFQRIQTAEQEKAVSENVLVAARLQR